MATNVFCVECQPSPSESDFFFDCGKEGEIMMPKGARTTLGMQKLRRAHQLNDWQTQARQSAEPFCSLIPRRMTPKDKLQ